MAVPGTDAQVPTDPPLTGWSLARWSPWQDTLKQRLTGAAQDSGLTPRPTWLHPSNEEFEAALRHVCDEVGIEVVQQVELRPRHGRQGSYQTHGAWSLHAPGARPGFVTWDTDKGELGGRLVGSAYAPLVERSETLVEAARASARVRRQNLYNQVALAAMETTPCAPFVTFSRHQMNGGWVIYNPSSAGGRALEAFCQSIEMPLRERREVVRAPVSLRAAIEKSAERARARFGPAVGWVAISDNAHAALLEEILESQP